MSGGFRTVFNSLGLLFLRVSIGGMMAIGHGWGKVQNFEQYSNFFPAMFGLDSKRTLMLAIFGEVVCPVLVALGLLTRLAGFAAAFTMVVAAVVGHGNDPFFNSGNMVVTTSADKVHTGFVTAEDEKQVVIATSDGPVTIPRSEVKSQKPQAAKELAILFMIPFAALVLTGPGKVSIDAMLFREKKQVIVKV